MVLHRFQKIPYVTATAVFGDRKKSGRTKPFQISCDNEGKLEDYIVKIWADPQLHLGKHCLAREIWGSMLAEMFGIKTPEISIVIIEPDFYRSQNNENAEILRLSIGNNFGSKYRMSPITFSPPLRPKYFQDAVKIFCFDMLIGNSDRRVGNPNVFEAANGFEIFDHESAFPYSKPSLILGGCPPGWTFIKETWHKNHVFYQDIHNRECSSEIEEFMTDLGMLSNEILDTIEEQIPEDWHTGNDILNIKSYLANTRDNMHLFKRSLQEILV